MGRQLMTATIAALATRYRSGALWVLETNSRAIRFYESTGWRADGTVKNDLMAGVEIRDLRHLHDLQHVAGHPSRDPLS